MSQQLILTILSASVVAALVAGAFTLVVNRNEYANEYYKTVVARRVHAYEMVEALIVELRTSVIGEEDNRPYHLVFSSEEKGFDQVFALLHQAMSEGLWLSDEIFEKVRDLNYLVFHVTKPSSVIAFGKENYQRIATLRAELERLVARDMMTLHKVKKFLASKNRPDAGFHAVHLKR
jgi:hypothetical protein